jgi:hypothetical protein
MTKPLQALLAAGAAALALAAASPALAAGAGLPLPSDEAYTVPAGKIEHRVEIRKVSGAKAIPSHTKTETWLSGSTSRTVVTDLETRRTIAETVATRRTIRVWNADTGILWIKRRSKPGGLPENSAAFEAAVQRAYVEQGRVTVTGETVVDGRRALVTRSVERNWRSDEPGYVVTAIVDAETFTLYARTTVNDRIGIRQEETYRTELLDATPSAVRAKLAMTKRKHAKIRRRPSRR